MKLFEYLKATKGEMKHVSWPTRHQTIAYTLIVIVVSVFVAFYLGLFDWILTMLLDKYVI